MSAKERAEYTSYRKRFLEQSEIVADFEVCVGSGNTDKNKKDDIIG